MSPQIRTPTKIVESEPRRTPKPPRGLPGNYWSNPSSNKLARNMRSNSNFSIYLIARLICYYVPTCLHLCTYIYMNMYQYLVCIDINWKLFEKVSVTYSYFGQFYFWAIALREIDFDQLVLINWSNWSIDFEKFTENSKYANYTFSMIKSNFEK